MQINEPTPAIAAAHRRFKRNRDMIAGEDAVKAARHHYMPVPLGQDGNPIPHHAYDAYLKRLPFFAGAARTFEGLKGLIFRKDATFEFPAGLEPVMNTITQQGDTVDDLAEELFGEHLATCFTGLYVDHPAASGGLTLANAIAGNNRPFVFLYPAETILEVTAGVVNNVRKITRVRLMDDEATVRELRLDDGVYTVTLHHFVDGVWIAEAPMTPLKQGRPLDTIPFVLDTAKPRSLNPEKGPMDDICHLNVHLYQCEANEANALYYASSPIPVIKGAALANVVITPGIVLQFPDATKEAPVETDYWVYDGAAIEHLSAAVATKKDEMAKHGSSILASEKSAAEAAETHAIRRASENSILAMLARRVSRSLTEVLNIVADWMGAPPCSYQLNTDFLPMPATAQEMTAYLAQLQAGAISHETFINLLITGEVLPEDFDYAAEKARLDAESLNVDRPTPPVPPAPGA